MIHMTIPRSYFLKDISTTVGVARFTVTCLLFINFYQMFRLTGDFQIILNHELLTGAFWIIFF